MLDHIPVLLQALQSCRARIFNLLFGNRGAEKAAEQQVAGLGKDERAIFWQSLSCVFDTYI